MYYIYAKTGCIYCKKAVQLADELQIPFILVPCDHLLNYRGTFLALMEQLAQTPIQTFPIIFQDNRYIGGFSDFEKLHVQKSQGTNWKLIDEYDF